ncbi:MAG TPA: adenylate/guanylate cyclase domain-containing protein, partial [Thermoanaerobaculia bacterium]|nr:adenylate/guanylate cyclase domain-containing protein [Thermoanaerobaculia bacterium]
AEQHGLEKIKTIGDSYMVVAGIPQPIADHALVITRMAIDMIAGIEAYAQRHAMELSIRVGIHTGSVVAGELGWPHAWLVMGIEIEDGGGSARVTREMESGMNEIFRLKLPAVLQVQAGINHPRYPSLKGIMAAKKKPIDDLSPTDLGLSAAGSAASRIELVSVAFPESGGGAEILQGDTDVVAKLLVEKLTKEARVIA